VRESRVTLLRHHLSAVSRSFRNGRLASKGELFVQLPDRLRHPSRFQVQAEAAHILEVGRDLPAGGKVEASLPAGLDERSS
jgi:trans-aconitate methyltransferase